MQLVHKLDLSAIAQLNLAIYYFAQASLEPKYYWPLDLTQGFAYLMPFMMFSKMVRDDSSHTRRGYLSMRRTSTQVFYGLAVINLIIDYSLYEVIPVWGIIYLVFMGMVN